ncbi:MAG: sigma-54-dependent Fis family transcriptional regulator [Alphaproteobacteria bacterium]|nr:sigma-54-dependent Fis family transcriptional regulator [Rhodospirillales bacterium]MCW9046022.1 sigma-54-dependent Fis family transcriptional regulator [Alphaproteobacteria bacterium]
MENGQSDEISEEAGTQISDANTYRYTWEPGTKVLVPRDQKHDDSPDIDDLTNSLRFSPNEGRIWFENDRMALLHLSTLGSMRQSLIDKLGEKQTRGLLTRMGYAGGVKDAAIARKLRPNSSFRDAFLVGPQLHNLHGMVSVQPIRLEGDTETGQFYGEWIWTWCCDAESHLEIIGPSEKPVCWMQLGYATGYTSAFVGGRVIYREVECHAQGDPHCRIIGKNIEGWEPEEIQEELQALQPEEFANRPMIWKRDGVKDASTIIEGSKAMVDVVGASQGFVSTCHMLQKVAKTSATVLFLGETGVGKGVFARTLHQISDRADHPFISLNCAAIPEELIEAELFGVEKGAYTDASQSRPGRFERANGGTLFLDEVGTLTLTAQVKLLRALQEREVERVGGTSTIKVDVRIIAATNIDLSEAVKAGTFREDLLFRLNVFPISIPPLRERREDIPLLMDYFLHQYAQNHGRKVNGFTELALDALYQYDYPGNIRELENLLERAIILVEDENPIDVGHLFVDEDILDSVLLKLDPTGLLHRRQNGEVGNSLLEEVIKTQTPFDDIEQGLISEAVKRSGGNIAKAARMLGLKRSQVAYKVKLGNEN